MAEMPKEPVVVKMVVEVSPKLELLISELQDLANILQRIEALGGRTVISDSTNENPTGEDINFNQNFDEEETDQTMD